MDEAANTRWWSGVGDDVHPLDRCAHASVTHGRYIYVISGYSSKDNDICLFDRAGLTRYDPLSNSVHFLPIHWDSASLKRHGCNQSYLNTSGLAVALQADSDDGFIYIYAFAGFSLLDAFHTNSLVRFQIPQGSPDVKNAGHCSPTHRPCVRASVLSGHSLLCHILSLTWDSLKGFILYTTLRALQRRLRRKAHSRRSHLVGEPSPRDKMCIEYWNGQLFVFGGYGPDFSPPDYWPVHILNWPFLYDPRSVEWFLCEHNRGWNNQLLIYNISQNRWSLTQRRTMKGQSPCARAAHQSCVHSDRGWLFIFGGRGPVLNQTGEPYESGRLNDLYCLDLNLLEWTRVTTPLDLPEIQRPMFWPCGRSWMGLTAVQSTWSEKKQWKCILNEELDYSSFMPIQYSVNFFIAGGFSNSHEALSDMYLIEANTCPVHNRIEARVVATTNAQCHNFGCRPLPNPSVIDGFKCTNKGEFMEQNCVRIMKGSHSVLANRDQDPIYLSQFPFIQNDLKELMTMYNSLDYSPSTQPVGSSNLFHHPFSHIAGSHRDIILYLLSNFCCFTKTDDVDSKVDTRPIVDEIDNLSTVLFHNLDAAGQVLSTLASIIVRFMLPWEPLVMVLSEKNVWLSESTYTLLLNQLISVNSVSYSDFVTLFVTEKSSLDHIITLLPVDEIKLQCPAWSTISHLHQRLSLRVRHAILSFLVVRDEVPLSMSFDRLDLLSNPPTSSHVPSFTLKPIGLSNLPRFWHSINQAIDGCFYVIGGHQTDSTLLPVECFHQLEPLSLKTICLRRASELLVKHCARFQKFVSFTGRSTSKSPRHLLDKPSTCSCTFCTQYQYDFLQSQLLSWVL